LARGAAQHSVATEWLLQLAKQTATSTVKLVKLVELVKLVNHWRSNWSNEYAACKLGDLLRWAIVAFAGKDSQHQPPNWSNTHVSCMLVTLLWAAQ
jgi:hypothetical protein